MNQDLTKLLALMAEMEARLAAKDVLIEHLRSENMALTKALERIDAKLDGILAKHVPNWPQSFIPPEKGSCPTPES